MLRCPHCRSALTLADLRSRRLLCLRTCAACRGEYFEGGTTEAMMVVGAGAALAGSLNAQKVFAAWVPLAIAFGFAFLGVLYTHRVPPRKASELRRRQLQAVVAGPVSALLVWKLIALAS